MERAIVRLRKQQAARRLRARRRSRRCERSSRRKEVIDELKRRPTSSSSRQGQETISQAYVKMLEDQKKLEQGHARASTRTRNADDGKLPREMAIRLGQLPGEQGRLSETRRASSARSWRRSESIVYVWANKDIVSSMDDVKDELGKPDDRQGHAGRADAHRRAAPVR